MMLSSYYTDLSPSQVSKYNILKFVENGTIASSSTNLESSYVQLKSERRSQMMTYIKRTNQKIIATSTSFWFKSLSSGFVDI